MNIIDNQGNFKDTRKMGRQFTWRELSHYNKRHNAHVAYRGKVYDVSNFVAKHPGGADQIMLGAGRDITVMFDSYHPLDIHKYLEQYYVGELVDNETPVFPEMGEFYKTLRQRVDVFFKSSNIDPKMDYWMILRYVCIIMTAIFFHVAMIYCHSNLLLAISCSLGSAFFSANIGLSLSHDASHFAITHKPWVWKVLGAVHDFLLGASQYVWTHQHVVGHHPYTNIDGIDPDIHTADSDKCDWRRLKFFQKWFPHYAYQHIYMPLLYCLYGVRTRIRDVIFIINLNYGGVVRMNPLSHAQLFLFIAGKLFWLFHHIILPLYFMPWPTMVFLTILADFCASYYLIFLILTSHVIEQAEVYRADKNNNIQLDWAELQLSSTVDYATSSWFWTIFSGAINHQTIHHLFPGVLQSHYPKLVPIVRQTCKEFGLEYKYIETMPEAIMSHVCHLKSLGQNVKPKKLQ